jgi:drug/metabolite transporter (DMT)-like permease
MGASYAGDWARQNQKWRGDNFLFFGRAGRRLRLPMTSSVQTRAWLVATAAMLIALFFWAVVPLFLEHFTHLLDPWTANGARYFFAAAFWLPFVIQALRRMAPAARGAAWRAALIPAAAHCAGQVCFGLAPYYNNATMLNFGCRLSIPFATLFGFWLLKSERPLMRSPLFWMGLLCAGFGFLLMFEKGFGTDSTSVPGMGLLLGFAVLWGLYVVFVRRNLADYPVHLSYGMVSLLTFPPLLALMFWLGDWPALFRLALDQWAWLLLSALIGLTLGHVFYYRAILVMGPIASEGGMLLIPFQTAILAHFFLGERLSPAQWTAGGILILGCGLLIRARFAVRE